MSGLSKKERFKILEMVSEIASEAAKTTPMESMVEFQSEFIESLYHTMASLVEDDHRDIAAYGDDPEEEEEEEEDLGNRDERVAAEV